MKTAFDIIEVTSRAEVKLPFRIIRACRCSFEVEFPDGTHAYITNQNLFRFMNNEVGQYALIERNCSRHGTVPFISKWVIVSTNVWTEGHMPRMGGMFGCDGNYISL